VRIYSRHRAQRLSAHVDQAFGLSVDPSGSRRPELESKTRPRPSQRERTMTDVEILIAD
jgi:hypothetical protein